MIVIATQLGGSVYSYARLIWRRPFSCPKVIVLAIFGRHLNYIILDRAISNHWADPREWSSSTADLELGYSLSPLLQSATLSGETLHVTINLTVIRVCGPRVDR